VCEWQEPANRFMVFSCFFTMLRIWAFGHARLPQSGIFLGVMTTSICELAQLKR